MTTDSTTKREETPSAVVRKRVVAESLELSADMTLVMFEASKKVRNVPLLVSFCDIGITPMLVASHYVDQFELPLIGSLFSREMGPSATVKAGQPGPAIQIYGNEHLALIMSEAKIKDTLVSSGLVTAIVTVAKHLESSIIFSAEGVPVEKIGDIERTQLNFLTTSQDVFDRLVEMEHKPLASAVIAGVTGGVLSECTMTRPDNESPDICVILAPTSSMFPDALSAVILIKLLDSLWDGPVSDVSKLEKGAIELEQKVKDMYEPAQTSESFMSLYG